MGFVEIQTVQMTVSHFKFGFMLPENGLACHSSLPKTSVNLGHFCFLLSCVDNCVYKKLLHLFFTSLTGNCKCKSPN